MQGCGTMDGSVEVYAWGRGDLGQLGLGDDKDRDTPTKIPNLADKDIVHITASDYHTVFLTGEGELFTTGNNDAGQLGEKSLKTQYTPIRVASLDTHTITHVACGQAHTVAVTGVGALVSWGTGEFGQLGHKEIAGTVDVVQPRIVRGSRDLHFAHVTCGAAHTLALTGGGDVYSFGQGNFGALGHGRTSNATVATLVESLWGLGIVQISSGENHSAALSIDGQVFTWGRGKYGQLGHGSTENELKPTAVKALSDQMIVQIACGGDHTMAISHEGLLFTWGHGYWGQTGHGTQDDVLSPRQVLSLQKEQVIQASAGARHSIVMTKNEEIFVWGDGEQGQLGNSQSQMQLLPFSLKLVQMTGKQLLYVVAGGEHTLAVFQQASERELALQHERSYGNIMVEPPGELVCTEPMQVDQLANVVEENLYLSHSNQQFEKETKVAVCGEGGNIHGGGLRPLKLPCLPILIEDMTKSTRHLQLLTHSLDDIFSSVKFLTLTFKLKPDWYEKEEDTYAEASAHSGGVDGPGLDVDMIRATYQKVLELYNPDVVQKLGEAMIRLFEGIAKFMDKVPDSRWTRALLIGLQSPLVGEKGLGDVVSARLFSVFSLISASTERKLVEWMRTYPKEVFGGRFVRGVQRFITNRKNLLNGRGPIPQDVASAVKVLSILFNANQKGSVIAYNEFYNPAVSDAVDLQDEYLKWVHVRENESHVLVSFCQVPFILTPEAKSKVLQVEANLQKQQMVQASVVQHLFGNSFASPFLVLEVRRSSLIQDSLQQLSAHPYDLKKPLKVIFEGEAGVDEGGVAKEFFELLVQELFNVGYGMFTYNEESRNFWFNANSMETELEFQLVGIILGLAIYNNAILDVHFPLVVYKKLLGQKPQMEDFQDLQPQVLKSLQELLKFKGDVADTFGLTFQVTYDYFGEFRSHDLIPNGGDIIVTKDNRQRYVDLYVKYMLEESIQVQFAAFSRGFLQVCGGPALRLFCHEELELLICGLPHFDFVALEHVTIYQGGYTKQSQIVRWFWELVRSMTLEEKKQLLFFTTGNDRAPVGGLASLKFIIQRNGDDTDRLPTAHTCFNILMIPDYSSKLKLEDRLKLAISNSTGFGLQ